MVLFLFFATGVIFTRDGLSSLLIGLSRAVLRRRVCGSEERTQVHRLGKGTAGATPGSVTTCRLGSDVCQRCGSCVYSSTILCLAGGVEVTHGLHSRRQRCGDGLLLTSLRTTANVCRRTVSMLRRIHHRSLPTSLAHSCCTYGRRMCERVSNGSHSPRDVHHCRSGSFICQSSLTVVLPRNTNGQIRLRRLTLETSKRASRTLQVGSAHLTGVPFKAPRCTLASCRHTVVCHRGGSQRGRGCCLTLSSLSSVRSTVASRTSL